MTEEEFKSLTKQFAIRVVEFVDGLPHDRVASHFARQIVRSGTSVGANYRSACRAKSKPDMIAKLAIVEEEADETQYWLELLVMANRCDHARANELSAEADRILAMVVASIRTLRASL